MAEKNREVSQTQDDMAISYLDAQMGIKYVSLQISVSYFIISLILNKKKSNKVYFTDVIVQQ